MEKIQGKERMGDVITLPRKTVEMALSALEGCYPSQADQFLAQADASDALRTALDAEKPAEVEIVAWMFTDSWGTHFTEDKRDWYDTVGIESVTPLYTHPSDATAQIAELEKRESELNGDLKQCQNYCGQYVEQIAMLEAKLAIAVRALNHYAARSGSRVARMALEEMEAIK